MAPMMPSPSPQRRLRATALGAFLAVTGAGCAGLSDGGEYFGQTVPPEGQVLRYISGSEPQTMDPHTGTGQPEARLYAALYEGLVIYDPESAQPYPGAADRWEANEDNTQFTFHLRDGLQWSNGDPLTAQDFVYSFRRALAPELAAVSSYMGYEVLYAQAYNSGEVFLRDPGTGAFLVESEVDPEALGTTRVTLPADPEAWPLADQPALVAAVQGKDTVPVRAEDVGIEAPDDGTVRFTLRQPAPYFVGMLAHQFFMPVHRATVEANPDNWARPATFVGNGPFLLESWQPYDELRFVPNPRYWDADAVRLDEIRVFPMEDATTMMNLYKAGEVDATYNHTVPTSWLDVIGRLRDHMDEPENAVAYYSYNVNRPPMDNVLVRKAFNAAVDKAAVADFQRNAEPITGFTPPGIFPGYPVAQGDPFDPERARQLLAEAGYTDAQGNYDPSSFPIDEVELLYNTSESNRQIAEFIQAEWRRNLDLTVPLRNMEWQTYLETGYNHEYPGIARNGWVGDYLDPFAFLGLLADPSANFSGWDDARYRDMLERANYAQDPDERYALLADAEAYMLEQQPVLPLFAQTTNWLKKPYVKGLYANPITVHSWKHVYIEHDPARWDLPADTLD
jgi:oligopeptide transport system substrate-binding protein